MEADFAGYATRAGLKCSDGRVILPDAFKHQDKKQVPLVWQHGHTDPLNVLGHAILENRSDGMYCYGFLNGSDKASHAGTLLDHQDIKHLSIWANELIERNGHVMHGNIREVSLVLSGANPGAVIESVTIRHADGDVDTLPDEAIIHTGLEIETPEPEEEEEQESEKELVLSHADEDDDDETIEDVYNSMSEKQKQVLHFMLGEALSSGSGEAAQSSIPTPASDVKQSSVNTESERDGTMTHNLFDETEKKAKGRAPVLSHSDMKNIVADATKLGSLKEAVEKYATDHLEHGIDDIEMLFPEARALNGDTPEWNKRRTEWVNGVLSTARKSPFSRVKTSWADLTFEEARARGYVKGNLKKEEFFGVAKRVTTPTTIYKKQKLDRDDMVDITDFDVVAWLKGEMRLMLEEELARAILLGDGRDVAHEDKINEGNIRPIATDHDLYTTTINVNLDDASSATSEIIDAIVLNRRYYKGSGMPVMFTTETYIAQFLLMKDGMQRRMYNNLSELAAELRVSAVIPVEVMEEYEDIVCVLVNMNDYVIGADKGGEVNMFDDFDIDYNQYKYLIETRVSGALAKLKSAIVVRRVAGASTAVTPNEPTYDSETGEITIVNQTGVIYKNAEDDSVMNAAGSPYEVPIGTTTTVYATADTGKYFATSAGTRWSYRFRG